MNIVFASHTEIGSTFVVGSHHLSRELARRGHRVLHMSAPVTPAHLFKLHHGGVRQRFGLWARGGRADHEGVVNYVGFSALPWQVALRFASESQNLYARTLPSISGVLQTRNMWPVDALIVDQPQLAGIENLLSPKMLVYRATDLYQEMTGSAAVGLAEQRLARKAALLVGTSEPVLSHLHRIAPNTPTLLIENGVEFELFSAPSSPPPEYAHIPEPRAVYAGALDDRFDFEQMHALAQLPLQIVLIGPATPAAAETLGKLANVHLLGPRPYRTLPGYLQHAQIGLLPLTRHPANEGRSPMKLFEYGAAGLPVVATATRELQRRALAFVRLAENSETFVRHARELAADDAQRATLSQIARAHSAAYSWTGRTQLLLNALNSSDTPSLHKAVA